MSIILPTDVGQMTAEIHFMDSGGLQPALLQGPTTRLDRLGDRFALLCNMPPMKFDFGDYPAARRFIARLLRGKSEGVVMSVPQPDFDTGDPGAAPTIRAAAPTASYVAPMGGLRVGYEAKEGQFVSIRSLANGRWYLYNVFAGGVVPAGGNLDVQLTPRIRKPLAAGDQVQFADPQIEGHLPDDFAISFDTAWHTGLTFTIAEDE